MPIFEEVGITWKGREYVIPPDGVMKCIAKIEDVITMNELYSYLDRGNPPLGKLSQAFAAVLRHAGARVRDEEVYASMFDGDDTQDRVISAVDMLLRIMLPPDVMKENRVGKPSPADASSS